MLNTGVRDQLGGLHSARLLVSTVDFAPIERMQTAGDGRLLARRSRPRPPPLEAGGADLVLIATNTMHKVHNDVTGWRRTASRPSSPNSS